MEVSLDNALLVATTERLLVAKPDTAGASRNMSEFDQLGLPRPKRIVVIFGGIAGSPRPGCCRAGDG